MTLKDKETMTYECDKCKCEIFGGFDPTGFIFDHGGFKGELCKPCYIDYWEGFKILEKSYVDTFFNK